MVCSKLKIFADDSSKMAEKAEFVFNREENILWKKRKFW